MSTPKLFANKGRVGGSAQSTMLDNVIAGIKTQLQASGSSFVSKQVASSALSMESINDTQRTELDSSITSLNHALESVMAGAGVGAGYTVSQKSAAAATAIISSDIAGFLKSPIERSVIAQEGVSYVSPQGGDFTTTRLKEAMESYDEKENKNAVVYSVAYNLQAARQDEFGETFFPTVVVTPDQVGFAVSIRLVSVYNEVRRQISGNLDQFNKRNIIQAVIDPTILKNDQTRIVPVYRDESKAHFVDAAVMAPKNVLLEGETITTSALGLGKKFSLLAISQTDALLETGLQDTTDSIDTSVVLSALYFKVGTDVIKFNTNRLPTSTFTYAVQGNYRLMNLAFTTNSLLITGDTKTIGGAAPASLADVKVGGYSVRLSVSVSGSVNCELGDTTTFASEVTVQRVVDAGGADLALDSGAGKTIADLFVGSAMVGYDLEAQRTNLNRRMRGQLLDTTFYNQVYSVPLRSPITIPRPLTVGDVNDSSDLAALITATHIRTSNAAVDELLRVKDILKEYVDAKDSMKDTPEILGVARFLVQPFFEEVALNMAVEVNSLRSADRAMDIQAVLVNQMRDLAYRMYRDSGYKAAADALAGGMAPVPTVIIGTDPVLSRYLTVTGDLRTLGNDFNVKIVSTLNNRMAGKIVMSFGEFGGAAEGVPNPMHFGNMAWKPELTLVLPLHRNGANSKELTVQPSFVHVTNLPLMAVITVTGIKDVASKSVPVRTTTV